jgi:hypothetical protein
MENKTTTELLDLLKTLIDKDGNLDDKWSDVWDEIIEREPFYTILHPDHDESIPALLSKIEELEAEIKKLKRHKHDEKSGDVLIRI